VTKISDYPDLERNHSCQVKPNKLKLFQEFSGFCFLTLVFEECPASFLGKKTAQKHLFFKSLRNLKKGLLYFGYR